MCISHYLNSMCISHYVLHHNTYYMCISHYILCIAFTFHIACRIYVSPCVLHLHVRRACRYITSTCNPCNTFHLIYYMYMMWNITSFISDVTRAFHSVCCIHMSVCKETWLSYVGDMTHIHEINNIMFHIRCYACIS